MKAVIVLALLGCLVATALPAFAESATATKGGADVGTTSSQMFGADARRRGGIVQNAGTARVWCAFGEAAAENSGFFFDQGGILNMTDGLVSTQALNCVTSTATQRLTWELFR